VTVYRFVDAEKAGFPVTTMYRALGVSPSGYWSWSGRPPSARALADRIERPRLPETLRVPERYGVFDTS
jgi:hypothetical protein